jgi:hypothetical protein
MRLSTKLAAAMLAASIATMDVQAHTPTRNCMVTDGERESMLRQDYQTFDTASGARSWRALLQSGCIREAVDMLEAYRARNGSRLTLEQRLELNFHIGQTLAFGGRDTDSLPYFESARADGASDEWNAYVDATIAFIRKDRAQLEAARRRYLAAASREPMRVRIIDGLLMCLDKPYTQAVHCSLAT